MATKRDALAYQISTLPLSYVPRIEDFSTSTTPTSGHKISAFNLLEVPVKEPKLAQWDFLDQIKTETLLKIRDPKEMYDFIASSLKTCPKGRPKEIFVQLMSDAVKFCQKKSYDTEKSATVLSQFYLSHIYFTSRINVTADKIYSYFKELMMSHCLPFPPSQKKVFNIKEANEIMQFFCQIYLRNLPLITYLSLPNFALYLNYEIPPLPVLSSKKKKGKKHKDKGGKKKPKKKK